MSNNITISREQQRDLHNARAYFHQWYDQYRDVLGQRVIDDFSKAFGLLIQAHNPIRAEEDKRWDERNDHYNSMKACFGFKSVWSDYDIERLDDPLPSKYLDITHVKYYSQLVAVEKREAAAGLDWIALWAAADKAIEQSGDTHHIFVEGFYKDENDPVGVYRLTVGS